MKEELILPFCACGCGGRVTNPGNKWIVGHNSKGKNNGMYGTHRSGSLSANWKGGKVTVKCVICGTEIERWPYEIKEDKDYICSKECEGKLKSKLMSGVNRIDKVIVQCLYCGFDIERYECLLSDNNFCDQKCFSKWRAENLSGKDSPKWKRILVKCDQCGNEFYRKLDEFQQGRFFFCTNDCRKEYVKSNHNKWINPINNKRIISEQLNIPLINLISTRRNKSHKKQRGASIELNGWFSGCDGHHITPSIIINIPSELHRHINHNLKTGYNMGEINMLALQYLNGYYDG